MQGIAERPRVKVSADGDGVLSHAGASLVREVADLSGLTDQITAALADTYSGPWRHAPGAVFADLAAAIADGADCVDRAATRCAAGEWVFGESASTTTMWRLIDQRINAAHLESVIAARNIARARAWEAGAAPSPECDWLRIDVDATITLDHSDNKENAAATWKHTYGFHPLLAFLDRPDISAGEALAALLRPGNAGSNTAADHITVLDAALAALPPAYRPDTPGSPKILIRSDSAGATHAFAAACRDRGVGFSFGVVFTEAMKEATETLNAAAAWTPAIDDDGEVREGAWVAEATDLVDLSVWPAGTRLILRKERPHPGAQLRFTDSEGHRVTGLITDTPARQTPGGV
ncbi:IS1380 family transposase, partial [Gordonia sp. NPDC003424]